MVFSNDRLMRYVICLLWLVSCHQFLKLCYFPFVHWLYLNNVFIMLNFVSLFSIDSLISFWLERNYHREADADFSKVTFTAYLPSFLETFYKNLSSTVSLSIIPSDSNDQHCATPHWLILPYWKLRCKKCCIWVISMYFCVNWSR